MDAFRRAQRHQAHRWFEQTVEIADESQAAETVPEIGSFQLRVRARQWAASRLAPDEFGDQVQHQHAVAGRVVIHLPSKNTGAPTIDGRADVIETLDDPASEGQSEATSKKP
jgi:hypothetical protein